MSWHRCIEEVHFGWRKLMARSAQVCLLVSCLLLLSGIGCNDQGKPDLISQQVPDEKPSSESAISDPVELKTTSFAELQTLIASHKNDIVVCDYWATSCAPCIKEFPRLVQLHGKYKGEKVVCISASLDFEDLEPIEDYHKNTLVFLKQQGASFENVLLSEDNLTVLDEKLAVPSLPIVEVYEQSGKLSRRFEGKFTYENDVLPHVEKLFAEQFGK